VTRAPYGAGAGLPGQGTGGSYIHPLPLPPIDKGHHHHPEGNGNEPIVVIPWWAYSGVNPWDVWDDDTYGSGNGPFDNFNSGNNNNGNSNPIPPMLPPPPPGPTAQDQIQSAQQTMAQVRDLTEKRLEASPEWQRANAAVLVAQAELDAANAKAKETLSNNSDYRTLQDRREKIEAEIARIHRTNPNASPAVLTPLAVQDMDAGTALNEMQDTLLAQDPNVAQARRKLAAASAQVEAMKRQVDADVMADPAWQAAQRQLQAARQHLAAGQ
jgi:hypothetical protein